MARSRLEDHDLDSEHVSTMTTAPSLVFDHIAVVASSLEDGIAHVRDAIGVDMPAGGRHPRMGTHNHLLRLGPTEFLEVIAVDPASPPPGRPRWFDLDRLSGPPRLANWIVATPDIRANLAAAPPGCGRVFEATRGSLTWLIAVPDDGSMPYGGGYPTLIQWPKGPHPASTMNDTGCALRRLRIEHPHAAQINGYLDPVLRDDRIDIVQRDTVSMRATIATPHGERELA